MATHHDQLMKELIAAFPGQFLRLAAPEIATQIDLEGLFFEPEEHYTGSRTGYARRGDLISRASVQASDEAGDEEEEVLIHIEIELRYRAIVKPRLLRYQRGLTLKHELPVHTIVIFLRGGPAGSEASVYEEHSLGRMVGAIGYHSLGLSQAPAAEYLAREEPLAWGLAALMRCAKGQSRSQLGIECVYRIAGGQALNEDERGLLLGCVFAYVDFEDEDAREFDRIVEELEDEEVQDVRMSMTERWRREGLEQGREQGREEGRREGRREGRKEGARELVLGLLGRRFGSLSAEVQRRVAAITSAEELSRLAERALQVESLEELGLA